MQMVRMCSDLRLKRDVELPQAAYLKFHSVFTKWISRECNESDASDR
jgi:hypothetical protein